ncbi:MAG: DUF4338 domain-containing protein [Methylococcaceae bacterium]|nr:DUF4338 domain-containing protein [Methylococcaceae bacterium]
MGFRHPYDRRHLIANSSRCLILPQPHYPNLASRVLALCARRLRRDWRACCGFRRTREGSAFSQKRPSAYSSGPCTRTHSSPTVAARP